MKIYTNDVIVLAVLSQMCIDTHLEYQYDNLYKIPYKSGEILFYFEKELQDMGRVLLLLFQKLENIALIQESGKLILKRILL